MGAATPARLVCFISGGGRTVLNLQDTIDRGELNATIPLVVASRACAGVDRCRARGIETRIVTGDIPENDLHELLTSYRADLVCLAGYLRLLPVPSAWTGRILNIHPALLPKHGGAGMFGDRVHRAVLDAREPESGCTVHVCNAEYDDGDIILQRACPVQPGDTVDTLAARVFEQECISYPEAIRTVLGALSKEPNA